MAGFNSYRLNSRPSASHPARRLGQVKDGESCWCCRSGLYPHEIERENCVDGWFADRQLKDQNFRERTLTMCVRAPKCEKL